jgi:hypothetical protein
MFAAAGFPVAFVDDAPHEVSQYLKELSPRQNYLLTLFKWFSNFELPFTLENLRLIRGIEWSSNPLKEGSRYSDFVARGVKFDGMIKNKAELPSSEFDLISLGKTATQSSVSEYSSGKTVEEDAGRALDVIPTGGYRFHTATEDRPWWKIDLAGSYYVKEIRLFNRLDHADLAARASRFEILVSDNNESWTRVHRKDDFTIFGGADGRPYRFLPTFDVVARFVMIRLLYRNCLHLEQVQVFGCPEGEVE